MLLHYPADDGQADARTLDVSHHVPGAREAVEDARPRKGTLRASAPDPEWL